MSACLPLALGDALASATLWFALLLSTVLFLFKPFYRFLYLPLRVSLIKRTEHAEHEKARRQGRILGERKNPHKLRRYWNEWLDIGFFEDHW